jgi:alkylation response protein AidB-like acyl-CoA dehydrogenase
MDLNLTPAEQQFRDELAAWLKANVPADWGTHRLHDTMQDRFTFLCAWQKRVFEAGWAGVSWPKAYGGRGATLMEQVIFTQEMAKAGAPPLANVLGLSLIGPTIIAYGTDAQKKRFLANILSGDEIWC